MRRSLLGLAGAGRGPVLVAVSGGADSTALLAAALREAGPLGLGVGAVTVDHALQPGSHAVAAEVLALARGLGARPAESVRVQVGSDGGPEAAARDARYTALAAAARAHDAPAVLLGHTLDDQAETVLLGLARGSGARSLAAMADDVERDGVRYLRPLLRTRRATTSAACAELGVEPWPDPHNTDPAFARARVRAEALPVLDDVLGPGVAEALARSARLLRDDADALDAWAARELARLDVDAEAAGSDGAGLDAAALALLPAAVRRRVLRLACLRAGVPGGALRALHLDALDALVASWRGQGPVALPGGVEAARACGRVTLRGR